MDVFNNTLNMKTLETIIPIHCSRKNYQYFDQNSKILLTKIGPMKTGVNIGDNVTKVNLPRKNKREFFLEI